MLGTASAACSHCEGNEVPRVAVQSRGPESTLCEVYLPPAGLPRRMYLSSFIHYIILCIIPMKGCGLDVGGYRWMLVECTPWYVCVC